MYAVPRQPMHTENGGELAELTSAEGMGLETALLQEWRRIHAARLQSAH